jgi:hypothetical protein
LLLLLSLAIPGIGAAVDDGVEVSPVAAFILAKYSNIKHNTDHRLAGTW